ESARPQESRAPMDARIRFQTRVGAGGRGRSLAPSRHVGDHYRVAQSRKAQVTLPLPVRVILHLLPSAPRRVPRVPARPLLVGMRDSGPLPPCGGGLGWGSAAGKAPRRVAGVPTTGPRCDGPKTGVPTTGPRPPGPRSDS